MDEDEGRIEVPISAIAHWAYCPRRVSLIHVEQTFDENVFTVRGRMAHARVDTAPDSSRRGVRTVRHLPLLSKIHGLHGKADVVELHGEVPLPVEYKLSGLKGRDADLQLCAQAFCLEEQFGVPVPKGAVYSYRSRRRRTVLFDLALRENTELAIAATREIILDQLLPRPVDDARCPQCSLLNACLPSVTTAQARLRGVQSALFRPLGESVDEEWD